MCVFQLQYKLMQPFLRFNKGFSFNISKFYLERFTTTDSKSGNILRIGVFQVASNCCFRSITKKTFFVFAYIYGKCKFLSEVE